MNVFERRPPCLWPPSCGPASENVHDSGLQQPQLPRPLWSEEQKNWTVAQVEIPRPPVKWKPGRGKLPFALLTPGIEAQHVKLALDVAEGE